MFLHVIVTFMPHLIDRTENTKLTSHICRFKGKRAYPTIPNQPSEASAYFMFELAKIVLAKAGGTSSTSLFHEVSFLSYIFSPGSVFALCVHKG